MRRRGTGPGGAWEWGVNEVRDVLACAAAEVGSEIGVYILAGVLLIIVLAGVTLEMGHRYPSGVGSLVSQGGVGSGERGMTGGPELGAQEKRRQGGARGGKQLRRRKEAILRQSQEGVGGKDESSIPVEGPGFVDGGGMVDGGEGAVLRIGRLTVFADKVLGHGSQGTLVYSGELDDGRQVAIKRLLAAFVDVAKGEVDLLLRADAHPNITRYYAKEEDGDFVYLALELCAGSLAAKIESTSNASSNELSAEYLQRIAPAEVAAAAANISVSGDTLGSVLEVADPAGSDRGAPGAASVARAALEGRAFRRAGVCVCVL